MERLIHGDCLEVMRTLEAESVDAVVTDPPYGLEFMGKEWDKFDSRIGRGARVASERAAEMTPTGVAHQDSKGPFLASRVDSVRVAGAPFQEWCESWAREALRVLKPGGYLLAFGGSRTYHRLACAVEDAGFEIRDMIEWVYAQGFPKSLNVSKDTRFCACSALPYNHDNADMPGMRENLRDLAEDASTREDTDLLSSLQRRPAGSRVGEARAQRPERLDGREPSIGQRENVGSEQPRVERRSNTLQDARELSRGGVRAGAGVGETDGTQGRLHNGAPPDCGSSGGEALVAGRGSESQGPQSSKQRAEQSGTVAVERRPQAGGVWRVCPLCGKPTIPKGLGTALKPAHEPIVVARKPLVGTVAANVERYGTGAINVDGCRVGGGGYHWRASDSGKTSGASFAGGSFGEGPHPAGRFPANLCLDETAAEMLDEQTGDLAANAPALNRRGATTGTSIGGQGRYGTSAPQEVVTGYGDSGGASRFFYVAKASGEERGEGNTHPTVKPVMLMRWLVRLVTPPAGVVLDPFAGSGTTLVAALEEGFGYIGIEREEEYVTIARRRLEIAQPPLFGTD